MVRNKITVTILFIFFWGSFLSSCKTISDVETVKLNENLNSSTSSNTDLIQNQLSPTGILISPTFTPSPAIPTVMNIEPGSTNVTPTIIQTDLVSPLEGIKLEELKEIESNPFLYTGDGKDDGHHGTDFSFYQYKSFKKIENLNLLSMTTGRVSSVISNRPPYGNMIMVETPFSSLPVFLQDYLLLIQRGSEVPFHTNLSCPEFQFEENLQKTSLFSLYILYAHLYSPPDVEIGSNILSGNSIGQVGNTGSSGNPHLHLEFRIGPSGYLFEEMSHYDNTASPNEISNYCLWRVSGLFYQINPMEIIEYYLQNR